MTRVALQHVRTPLVFFCEHDLYPVGEIPIAKFADVILDGNANLIRLMHEAQILEAHKYLMLASHDLYHGLPLTETVQWSQRPHLASTSFYRKVMGYFPPDSNTMIEDLMYGVVVNDFNITHEAKFKLFLYTPTEGTMKRMDNSDGREDEPKFEMNFGTRQ